MIHLFLWKVAEPPLQNLLISYTCVPGTFVSNDPLHSGGENKKEGFSLFET